MKMSLSTVKRAQAQAESRLSRWIEADAELALLLERDR
jgi:hypothetical protein